MAKSRSLPARQRAAADYAARVARVRPFVSARFPSFARATRASKTRLRKIECSVFGCGDSSKPILGKHTTVVHLVPNKRAEVLARKKAKAYNAKLEQEWKAAKLRSPTSREALDEPSVSHVFKKATRADIARMKKDIGQSTPDEVNSIFIKQDKVPGEDNVYSGGSVVKLKDKYITVNGWQVIQFRPINKSAWLIDPVEEEKRVMDLLELDFVAIAAHFKKLRGWELTRNRATFSPQCQNFRYLEPMPDQTRVHNLLAYWRNQYGHDAARGGSSRSPVTRWLTGINLILFIGTDGNKQFMSEFEAQTKRRSIKKRIASQVKAARSRTRGRKSGKPAKPSKPPLRRPKKR